LALAKAYIGEQVLKQGLRFLSQNPERNINILLDWAERIAILKRHKEQVRAIKRILAPEDSVWRKFAIRMLKECNPRVKEKLAVNFFVNASLLGVAKQEQVAREIGMSVPFTLLIDPTARCNLRCTGCWAGEYEAKDDLDTATIDRIISEGKEMGIYFIVMSGGEPLLRKDDILALAEKHDDVAFMVYTNATLVDEKFAEDLARLGNVVMAISLEGFEEATDNRRGKGVYKKIMNAMDLLRSKGIVFGASTTYMRSNFEEVSSDAFVDMLVEKGCRFAWYFTYIPVGIDADVELMATPEQRARMFQRIQYFRKTRPIFLIDFWNDGEASNGCIAGGKRYLHINAAGEIEPCAFIHFATHNIKGLSLKEALQTPLMKSYQKRQPFNTNLLRPCPLIDNPEMLREIVEESGAHSTQKRLDGGVVGLTESLIGYSREWGEKADAIWKQKKEAANSNIDEQVAVASH